jgi:hypothetical protein
MDPSNNIQNYWYISGQDSAGPDPRIQRGNYYQKLLKFLRSLRALS